MQRKPVDVGNGQLAASFGVDGGWLSVGLPHPTVGMLELVGGRRFPAERDGDPAAVRAHRLRLQDPAYAFLRVPDARGELSAVEGKPTWLVTGESWRAVVTATVDAGAPAAVQEWRIETEGAGRLEMDFDGRLDRPGYAEITPVGPTPPPLGRSRLGIEGSVLEVAAPDTEPPAAGRVSVATRNAGVPGWRPTGSGARLVVAWDGDAPTVELRLTVSLDRGGLPPGEVPGVPPGSFDSTGERDVLRRITNGAVRYVLGCTALDVGEAGCCILTDHRLLPLSWTRDAYYQAALLLACGGEHPAAVERVDRHLAWLWGAGRDATGVWQRSHFTTGGVKDPAYQADQQLYPLLELVDFRRVAGRWPATDGDWGSLARTVWTELPRDPDGLLPGEENPADDPSELPYLLSSQLLLVHVARRLAEREDELELHDLSLTDDADRTLRAVGDAFACIGPHGPQWAYEADGRGGHRLYHDANDVPTALAPLWGLCGADDPWWRGTMRFAFSADNPGYVGGSHGGLGSAHTPGVWPLGDAQEWAVAVAVGDDVTAARVLGRLELVTSDDGMLPETYDPETGDWLARHWFAWPGALLGVLDRTLRAGTGPWMRGTE